VLNLEISDAKEEILKDDEIRSVAEIECHKKVREWLIEYVDGSVEKEFLAYRGFFRTLPENERAEILVAKNGGRVVGFLGLWKMGRYMEHVASIGISVHPDYWGNGIATSLIEAAIRLAKEKGFARLEIETLSDNAAMRHVAEKLGFKLESIRKYRVQKDGEYHDEAAYFMLLGDAHP